MLFWRLSVLLVVGAGFLTGQDAFVIQGAQIFDGRSVLRSAGVLVSGGKIRAVGKSFKIPRGTRVVDGRGKCLLPGLIDAHAHIQAREDLKVALRFGVTTYLDMFTLHQLAASIRAEQADRQATDLADLRSAGTLVTAPGGHGTEYGVPIPTLAKADEAQAFIDARIAEGSDYIKLVKDDGSAFGFHRPTLTQAVLAAAISAAHARGKLAVVHIATLADAREALAAGTDGLAHVYAGAPSAEVAREASRRGAFWTPTLSVTTQGCPQQTAARWDGTPSAYLSIEAKSNLRRKQGSSSNVEQCRWMYEAVRQMHAARVRLLAGTDVPNPGTAHGASLHGELALLVEAGLTPAEALAAATAEPAAAFGLSDRGRIAPGYRADLLLVDGDPLQDIRATRRIASVWKAGVEVTRTPPR